MSNKVYPDSRAQEIVEVLLFDRALEAATKKRLAELLKQWNAAEDSQQGPE